MNFNAPHMSYTIWFPQRTFDASNQKVTNNEKVETHAQQFHTKWMNAFIQHKIVRIVYEPVAIVFCLKELPYFGVQSRKLKHYFSVKLKRC